jgi:2-C-methyl-D-erythritol 4-phosphate cytidylyltransferase
LSLSFDPDSSVARHNSNTPYWAVMPAAGAGRRMGAAIPKQYLELSGRAVIEWSLAPFLHDEACRGVVVALAPDDATFATLAVAKHAKIRTVNGGEERSHSVRNGLSALAAEARADDWVLVHDAARPCLDRDDLANLLLTLSSDAVGGLLAVPLADTLKRAADAEPRVAATVPRAGLWRALTPQMFRFELLCRALDHASAAGIAITDEAQAVELLGLAPRLVAGRADNLKVTVHDDLASAQAILDSRAP